MAIDKMDSTKLASQLQQQVLNEDYQKDRNNGPAKYNLVLSAI